MAQLPPGRCPGLAWGGPLALNWSARRLPLAAAPVANPRVRVFKPIPPTRKNVNPFGLIDRTPFSPTFTDSIPKNFINMTPHSAPMNSTVSTSPRPLSRIRRRASICSGSIGAGLPAPRFSAASVLVLMVAALAFNPTSGQAANVSHTLISGATGNISTSTNYGSGGAPSASTAGDILQDLATTGAITLALDIPVTIGTIKLNSGGTHTATFNGPNSFTLDNTGGTTTNIFANTNASIGQNANAGTLTIAAGIIAANTSLDIGNIQVGSVQVSGAITSSNAAGTTLNIRNNTTQTSTTVTDTFSGTIGATGNAININNASIGSTKGVVTISGAIGGAAGTGAAVTLTNAATGAGAFNVSGILGASVSSVSQNSATSFFTISGNSSAFAGTVNINAGTLSATTSGNALGTGQINLGATSGTASATLQGAGFTYTNAINVRAGSSGGLFIGNSGNNATVFSGPMTLNNSVTLFGAGTGSARLGGNISGTGDIFLSLGGSGATPNLFVGPSSGSSTVSITGKIENVDAGYTGTGNPLASITANLTNVTGGVFQSSSSSNLALSGNNTFSQGVTIGAVSAAGKGGYLRINSNTALGTGTFTINGGGIDATVAGINETNNNAQTWNGDFTFAATQALNLGTGAVSLGTAAGTTRTITTLNTNALTLGGAISNGTTANSLTKAGTGTLILSGASNYTGATTISAGTLRISGDNDRLPTGTAVSFVNTAGATLDLNNLNQTIGSLTGGGTLGGNVTLGSGTLTVNGTSSPAAYAGVISGTGGLSKAGTGTLTLSGTNTYNGATNVNAGTLVIAGNQTGNGQLIVNNAGILQFGDGTSTNGSSVNSGTIFVNNTGTVAINKADGGTVTIQIASNPSAVTTLSGLNATGTTNTFTGTEFGNGGSFATNSTNAGATLAFSNSQAIDLKATNLTVGGAGNTLFSGSIYSSSNSGNIVTKNGAGTLIYQANQGYTGETDINAGAVRVDTAQTNGGTYFVGNGGTTATAASLLLGGGTDGLPGGVTFDRAVSINAGNGTDRTIGGTNTSGTNTFSGAVTFQGPDNSGENRSITLTAATGGTVAFTGGLTGGGFGVGQNVTKTGGGTVAIQSTASYFGTTTVSAGTLAVGTATANGSLSNTSGVTVTGGTLLLGGTGDRIADGASLTLGTGGKFGFDSTVTGGSETMGALTLSADSTIDFGTGTTNTLNFASLALNNHNLTVLGWTGTYYTAAETADHSAGTQDRLLFSSNPITGNTLGSISFYNDAGGLIGTGKEVSFGNGTYSFEIVPVPEPTTIFGALALLGLVGVRELRRKRRA